MPSTPEQDAWLLDFGFDVIAMQRNSASGANAYDKSPGHGYDRSPGNAPDGSPDRPYTKSPGNAYDLSPSSAYARSPATPASRFPTVDATATPTGMSTKRVEPHYEGEHNGVAWRGFGQGLTPTQKTHVTTKLYSAEEQAANELVQQPDGSFRKGDGSDVSYEGFAMDASGRMVGFGSTFGGHSIQQTNPDGSMAPPRTDMSIGAMRSAFLADPDHTRVAYTHHSSALGGEAVLDATGAPQTDLEGRPMMRSKPAALAGVVTFDDTGHIRTISNASGHYKPGVEKLVQGIEYLLKQGAFFTDEVTDAAGKALTPESEAFQLHAAVQVKLSEGKLLLKRLGELGDAEAHALTESESEDIGREIVRILDAYGDYVAETQTKLDTAQLILRKLGIGPANRIRGDATAEYVNIKRTTTAVDIVGGRNEAMAIGQFLKSGGGNEAALQLKHTMMEALKQQTAKQRDTLDADAQVRADKSGAQFPSAPTPTADDVNIALHSLGGPKIQATLAIQIGAESDSGNAPAPTMRGVGGASMLSRVYLGEDNDEPRVIVPPTAEQMQETYNNNA